MVRVMEGRPVEGGLGIFEQLKEEQRECQEVSQ